jgi:protein-L-isoaspartate(D-aspartate) O-methyltransferase
MTPSIDARTQMTYQQIRAWSVLTPRELQVFEQLRREDFVPEGWRGAAYGDLAIPLGQGQHMLTPTIVGGILQAVDLSTRDSVLEIGTGSGYLSACMARLAATVHSLEIRPELARKARLNLQHAGVGNAVVEDADAFSWQPAQPAYDVIVLTGSLPAYDARFESLLRPGGRLFVVTGKAPVMEARLVRLTAQGEREQLSLFETVFDPLDCPATPKVFEF